MNIIPWRNRDKNAVIETGEKQFSPISTLRDEMDQLFNRFFSDPFSLSPFGRSFDSRSWVPSIDAAESDKEVSVKVEIPGVAPENINVSLSGNTLTIEGEKKEEHEERENDYYRSERSFGSFRRSIDLPQNVDMEKVKAEHKNGVLCIRLAKQKGAEPKRIQVTAAKD